MTQETPQPTIYDLIGGEASLRSLVNRFYGYMDALPEAATIRAMHAPDLNNAREKMFMFLSGWLGGPNLYWAKYGHPRLRMRHFPFAIGSAERDQWLMCMRKAINDDMSIDAGLRESLLAAFHETASHMINRPD